MLLDRKTRKLTIARAISLDEELVKQTSLNIGERVAGWVAEQKMPVIINGDVKDHPAFAHVPNGHKGVRSAMSVPLKVNDTVVGVVNLNRILEEGMTEFDDADLRLAMTFARYCAAALQNARLCETLLLQNKQLMVMDRTRSGAVAELCHEMRTPLSAIVACVGNLLEGSFGQLNEKQKQKLESMKQQCNSILRFLEQMRSASDRKLAKELCSPKKLVEDCILAVETFYDEKGVTLSFEVSEQLPEVIADKGKIEQVLINLFVNACKYSDSGAKTVVSAQEKDEFVEFCVADTGRGIPEEHLKKIFEEFYRVEPDRPEPGLGLGLAISKRIIEEHGGKIWAESKVKAGSKFFFTLPTKEKSDDK